jgi:hypothetical protein
MRPAMIPYAWTACELPVHKQFRSVTREFERGKLDFEVTVDASGQVAGLHLCPAS